MARLAFLGTPDMAVPPLQALVRAGHDVALCVTRPDRKRGRGGALSPSPVKAAALELGLPVTNAMDEVASAHVDLAVVVAYGRIIPAALLEQVPMINLHFSLLPRWRGAAPVERAILAGDAATGVCLMKVEEGLDTGPVYAVRTVPIDDEIDLPALRDVLVAVGADMVVEALRDGPNSLPEPQPQVGQATIAEKISKEDLHLQWDDGARTLHRVVRLGHAWTTFRGQRLRVQRAAVDDANSGHPLAPPGTLFGTDVVTAQGVLRLLEVQPESRSSMPAEDWARGAHLREGEHLGSD